MTSTLQTVHRLLQKNNIPHEVVSGRPGDSRLEELTAFFPGEDGETIRLKAAVGCDGVFFTTHIRDLTERQFSLAETFAAELHRSVKTGLFTVSRSENEFSFAVYRLPGALPPTAEELAPLLFTGPIMAQLYGPALDLVLEEGVSVRAALDAVEKTDGKPVMSFVLSDLPESLRPASRRSAGSFFEEDDDDFPYSEIFRSDLERGFLTDLVQDYYDEQNWKYDYDPAGNAFRMRIDSCCVDSYRVITFIRGEEWFTTLTVFPIRVPKEKRDQAAEFIARANYGMILGCFEMDPDDGLLQFKDTCLCGEIELDMSVIERHIDVGFRMCDRYGPALLEMLFGNISPADAIRKAESDILEKNNDPPEEEEASEPAETSAAEKPARRGLLKRLFDWLCCPDDDAE